MLQRKACENYRIFLKKKKLEASIFWRTIQETFYRKRIY